MRLVKTGPKGEDPGLMEIKRPDGLGDIANLGLTLSEAKLLLANVQREIAAAQAGEPWCRIGETGVPSNELQQIIAVAPAGCCRQIVDLQPIKEGL